MLLPMMSPGCSLWEVIWSYIPFSFLAVGLENMP